MDIKAFYGEEFDSLVRQQEEWLATSKYRLALSSFFDGLVYGAQFSLCVHRLHPRRTNPVRAREDLLGEQKDAVLLASDWLRVQRRLESIVEADEAQDGLSVTETGRSIPMVMRIYDDFKQAYVKQAMLQRHETVAIVGGWQESKA